MDPKRVNSLYSISQRILTRIKFSLRLIGHIFQPPRCLWGKRWFWLLRWMAVGTWGWLETCYFDLRYMHGVHLRGDDLSDASNIWIIRRMLSARPLKPQDTLVDVGCGAGRGLRWLVNQGYTNRLVGVELDVSMSAMAARFLARFPNVEIIQADILQAIPDDATVFYLYNPFDEAIMQLFKDALLTKFQARGNVTLLYTNARLIHLFSQDPHWEVKTISDPIRDNNFLSTFWNPAIPNFALIRLKTGSL
jgi:SAM-dependent methyltransferase